MYRNLLRKNFLIFGCAILLATCSSTLSFAQERSPEQIIRLVADQVIRNTSYQFIHPKTKLVRASPDSFPQPGEIKTASIYNKWEYANGVLIIGMMQAARVLQDTAYSDYAQKNAAFIFNNLPVFEKSYQGNPKTEWAAFFRMGSLDDCGAMAAGLADVNQLANQPAYRSYLERAAHYILHQQHRLPDQTLSRIVPRIMTIWADDLYMSVPFLARMGKLTGDEQYFDDAIRQVLNFNKHLYDPHTGLYFHCWYSDVNSNGVAHWLRCNGWIAMAQVELLNHLPANHRKKQELTDLLLRQITGFSRYQDTTGLWHQLIDKPDAYLETSGTAMFVYAIAKAVNEGWIPFTYMSIAKEGWKGLTSRITAGGLVQDVCIGTGIADNLAFYYKRPKVLNEFHALGAVLLAATEMETARRLEQQKK